MNVYTHKALISRTLNFDDESKLLADNMNFYLNQLGAVNKPSFTSQIINHFKDILLDNDFYNKLDNHPYLLAF